MWEELGISKKFHGKPQFIPIGIFYFWQFLIARDLKILQPLQVDDEIGPIIKYHSFRQIAKMVFSLDGSMHLHTIVFIVARIRNYM